jgi:hypothetical protein
MYKEIQNKKYYLAKKLSHAYTQRYCKQQQ